MALSATLFVATVALAFPASAHAQDTRSPAEFARCKQDELSPMRFTLKTADALRALGPSFDPAKIGKLAKAKGCHSPAAWSWESLPGDSSIVLWLNANGMRVVEVRTEEKVWVTMNSDGGWGCDPANCRPPSERGG